MKFCTFKQFCCQNPLINHLGDAKDNLKFAELPVEEIVIKSDIAIKQEVLEPPDQGYYNTGWFNPEMRSRAVF